MMGILLRMEEVVMGEEEEEAEAEQSGPFLRNKMPSHHSHTRLSAYPI